MTPESFRDSFTAIQALYIEHADWFFPADAWGLVLLLAEAVLFVAVLRRPLEACA